MSVSAARKREALTIFTGRAPAAPPAAADSVAESVALAADFEAWACR